MKLTLPEKKMLAELNLENKTKYKDGQLMEWSTSEISPKKGEEVYYVASYGVYIAIKI